MMLSSFVYMLKTSKKRLGIFSITKKVILVLAITFLLFFTLLYYYVNKVVLPTLLDSERHIVMTISQYIYPDIDVGINFSSKDTLNDITEKLMKNNNIYDVYIHAPRFNVGTWHPFTPSSVTLLHDNENNVNYFAYHKLCREGYYVIYYRADHYLKEVNFIKDVGKIVVISLIIILGFIALILKFLLLPITQLSELIKKENAPAIHQLPEIDSNDERGDLIVSLKKFITKQRENSRKLFDLNQRLQETVQIKNEELHTLNTNMEHRVDEEVQKNREKERILHEQSRFAAMGEMLGNIAHQWRQPLSAINTAIGNAKIENLLGVTTQESLEDTFERVEEYTDYLSTTIEDFRNYFKQDKKRKNYLISDVIETVLSLTKANFIDITIIKEFGEQRIKLLGYPNELMQVLINILNNAKDVFEEKHIPKQYIRMTIEKTPSHVILRIYDNAGGIDKKIISNIFDPYFTTKHKAQGTGIGLYMSKEMIQKHMNGSLSVSNKGFIVDGAEQFGACFTITLPID